jgi:dihydrolipoamide dehydrogenase
MSEKRQLVIIGGGPGGYAAALRAAQLGIRPTLIEHDRIGGTCMNYGCIPTKFLLSQTKLCQKLEKNPWIEGLGDGVRLNWPRVQQEKRAVVERLVRGVEFLLQRSGVEVLKGSADFKGQKEIIFHGSSGERLFEAQKIILAMGASSVDLPFLKANGKEVITHREALDLEEVPPTLIVVGAGPVGLELGSIFARLGTDVTILEIMPTILPGTDKQMALRLERLLKKQGLKIRTGVRLEKGSLEGGKILLKGTCLKTRTALEFRAEKTLLAVGRKPNSQMLPQEFSGLLDRGGFIRVNSRLETERPGIYAVGDLIGGKLLAHKAQHEGIVAAENASSLDVEMDYRALPTAVFTDPELASVGLTEEEAKERGIDVRAGLFSLQANGRAVTLGSPEGLVKILAATDDRVLGGHILAPEASELVAEIALAIRKGLTLQDISSTIHVHPTLSEATMEAAWKAKGGAIHMLNE